MFGGFGKIFEGAKEIGRRKGVGTVWVFWKRSRPKLAFYVKFGVSYYRVPLQWSTYFILLAGDKVNGNIVFQLSKGNDEYLQI